MTELTPREWQVLTYIAGYIRQHNQAPSIREIARHVRSGPMAITATLDRLADKGVIHRPPPCEKYRRYRLRAISLVRGVQVAVRP